MGGKGICGRPCKQLHAMSTFRRIARRNKLAAWFPGWFDFKEELKMLREARRWRRDGWKAPLPGLIKRAIIKSEARAFGATTLVETGTYMGDTLWFFRHEFEEMYSIEVQPELARLARERFARWKGVHIIEGDSASCLAQVVPKIRGRAAYWLDGHYSAGITGRGAKDCPIWGELDAIVKHKQAPTLLLIDDARCFGTERDYPSKSELQEYINRELPGHDMTVSNDIIRIAPTDTPRPK